MSSVHGARVRPCTECRWPWGICPSFSDSSSTPAKTKKDPCSMFFFHGPMPEISDADSLHWETGVSYDACLKGSFGVRLVWTCYVNVSVIIPTRYNALFYQYAHVTYEFSISENSQMTKKGNAMKATWVKMSLYLGLQFENVLWDPTPPKFDQNHPAFTAGRNILELKNPRSLRVVSSALFLFWVSLDRVGL